MFIGKFIALFINITDLKGEAWTLSLSAIVKKRQKCKILDTKESHRTTQFCFIVACQCQPHQKQFNFLDGHIWFRFKFCIYKISLTVCIEMIYESLQQIYYLEALILTGQKPNENKISAI